MLPNRKKRWGKIWNTLYSFLSLIYKRFTMQNDEALRLRLSKELKHELQKLADRDNRKLSDYIRLVLTKTIEKEHKRG